jgi:hypothetical protein
MGVDADLLSFREGIPPIAELVGVLDWPFHQVNIIPFEA